MYKAVEDMTGSLVDNIQINFLLPHSLAQSVHVISASLSAERIDNNLSSTDFSDVITLCDACVITVHIWYVANSNHRV